MAEVSCSSSSCSSGTEGSSWSEHGDGDGVSTSSESGGQEVERSEGKKVCGKYVCSVCGLEHRKPALMKQHMCSHTVERPYICKINDCGRSYKRQDHLNRHSVTHQGKSFLCPVEGCEVAFTMSANLQRHVGLHKKWGADTLLGSKAVGNISLLCPESCCGQAFRFPSLLQTHMESVHGSVAAVQVVCMEPGCGEIFADLSKLRAHRRCAHCFIACEICGLSMMKKQLKLHVLQHKGELPCIQCPHPGCLHSYTTNSNLKTHIRAVHMEMKPFSCSYAGCTKKFAYKSVRDKHEKSRLHPKPTKDFDFETEDVNFMTTSRGGRKRMRLQRVDDLVKLRP